MNPIMNIRTFLKGGYRDLVGPTTIISGQLAIFTATPIDAAPGPAHPETEGALTAPPTGGAVQGTGAGAMPNPPADERTEAPSHGGTASSTVSEPSAAGRGRAGKTSSAKAPARKPSIQATLDKANKAGRG
jgi:hypothetical protein